MNITKDASESCSQNLLRFLGTAEPVRPVTLHQILNRDHGYSPRQISIALLDLIKEGLIEQGTGHGSYRLTDLGVAAMNQLLTVNDLAVVIPHPGGSALDIETGQLAIGTDARGNVHNWQLWNEMGARPCLVTGGSGSGGTNLLSGMVEAAIDHYPLVRTWLVDTAHQMGEYWDRVEKVATVQPYPDEYDVESTSDLFDQVLKVQRDRAKLLAQAGRKAWVGPLQSGLPLGLLVIGSLRDELTKENRAKLSLIMRQARRTGITVATHASDPLLASFGSDPTLRETFADGNLLIGRWHVPFVGGVLVPKIGTLEPIEPRFADGSSTAGVGYLSDGTLIRSYWSSGL
jgi:hypothetical protein